MIRLRALASAVLAGFGAARLLGALVGFVVILVGPSVSRKHRARSEGRQLVSSLATVAELAARSVRAGDTVRVALSLAASHVGGRADTLVGELLELAETAPLSDAVTAWAEIHDDPAVSVVAAAIGLDARGEGSAARALEAAAVTLRDRHAAARELSAWSSQARASATLLVVAPGVLGVGALLLRPTELTSVLANPLAGVSILMGIALEILGATWMAHMVRTSMNGQQ